MLTPPPTTDPSTIRILAMESFDAGSHAAVRESIQRWGRADWTWVTRPGRAWKWRMRTSAAELIDAAGRQGLLDQHWDVIFATSLTPVTDLRSMLPPHLRAVPLVLYMHENQVAYPVRGTGTQNEFRDHHFAVTNLTSMLASDRIIFNSRWNRDSFLAGIDAVLDHQPDRRPCQWARWIEARSEIAWPPVDVEPVDRGDAVLHNTPIVVWPCRWEHDKGPEVLLELARRHSEEWDIRWVLLGAQAASRPPEMDQFLAEQGDRILHAGFVEDRSEYLTWLGRADWVLSTAHHEFFGLAVVESILCGCLPWLPQRLSYPELLPEEAKSLSPGSPPADPAAVRRACIRHVLPSTAPTSVARLERLISATIDGNEEAAFWGMQDEDGMRRDRR